MEITWLGHACFRITDGSETLFIDPFLNDNPACPISLEDVEEANWVLVTHGHTDHYADAVDLAKKTGATLISNFEITEDAQDRGHSNVDPMNIGGSITNQGLTVHMTEAQHSSGPGMGHQAGFVLDWNGNSIYHSGDTGLFSDMKLISEFLDPDLGLLPIGDRFTMGPESAARAVEFLQLDQVIPMHYNTFEYVEQDPSDFENEVGGAADVVTLDPGESHQLL
ncbi:MAG: metal-dependent hydrolase [bacterium]